MEKKISVAVIDLKGLLIGWDSKIRKMRIEREYIFSLSRFTQVLC